MDKREEIMRAAEALAQTIRTKSASERQAMPSEIVAKQYNRIREEALKVDPKATLLPPEVPIDQAMGRIVVRARYMDIEGFCETIIKLLDTDGPGLGIASI